MCEEIGGMMCDKYMLSLRKVKLSLRKRTQNLNINQISRYNLRDFQVLW